MKCFSLSGGDFWCERLITYWQSTISGNILKLAVHLGNNRHLVRESYIGETMTCIDVLISDVG